MDASISCCGGAREKGDGVVVVEEGKGKGEGDEGKARGQMSCSSGGGGMVVGWSVQVQPQLVGDVVGGAGARASHSDSAWRDMAFRRCLRMRDAASAGEGKVVSASVEDEEDE
jgi:hypothetical protein